LVQDILRLNHKTFSFRGYKFPDKFLAGALGVMVGGIDKITPGLGKGIDGKNGRQRSSSAQKSWHTPTVSANQTLQFD
jgi:hypothetical protein